MTEFDRYLQMAKDLKMVDAKIVGPDEIFFDVRATMKCRWGCEDYFNRTIKCNTRGTSFQERVEMVKAYQAIMVVHSHDARALSKAVLEIEKASFLDGNYFAFAVRYCKLCPVCSVDQGKPCPTPEKVRPCDSSFGIDAYKTARNLGLPCDVLQNENDVQNRYGFVLLT